MPIVFHELVANNESEIVLGEPDTSTRAWVLYDSTAGSSFTADIAVGYALLPRLGDQHPSRPGMILRRLRAVPIDNGFRSYIITGSYTPPSASLSFFGRNYRVRVATSSEDSFITSDLDNAPIGEPYLYDEVGTLPLRDGSGALVVDTDHPIGIAVPAPSHIIEIEYPPPVTFNPTAFMIAQYSVNDAVMQIGNMSYARGTLQYIGCNASEEGDYAGDYAVVFQLRARVPFTIQQPSGSPYPAITMDLSETYYWRWGYNLGGGSNQVPRPVRAIKRRIFPYANLGALVSL